MHQSKATWTDPRWRCGVRLLGRLATKAEAPLSVGAWLSRCTQVMQVKALW